MKKSICIVLSIVALLAANATPGNAFRGGHFGHGGHFGVGVIVGPGWGPGWGYPYYPYYEAPPVVIQQQPETYIQQPSTTEEQGYWYFCQNPEGYYPYVKNCPQGWLKVVPAPPSGKGDE